MGNAEVAAKKRPGGTRFTMCRKNSEAAGTGGTQGEDHRDDSHSSLMHVNAKVQR